MDNISKVVYNVICYFILSFYCLVASASVNAWCFQWQGA